MAESRKVFLIVGGNAAGLSAAAEICRRLPESKREVVVLEQGEIISYSSCALPIVLAGKMNLEKCIHFTPALFEKEKGAKVFTGTRVTVIDPLNKRISAEAKEGSVSYNYDELLIATGASPVIPKEFRQAVEQDEKVREYIFTLKYPSDAEKLLNHIMSYSSKAIADGTHAGGSDKGKIPLKIVIVGAGFIGLEVAEALRTNKEIEQRFDLELTVVEKNSRSMSSFCEEAGILIEDILAAHNIKLLTGRSIVECRRVPREPEGSLNDIGETNKHRLHHLSLQLDSGIRLSADAVVLATSFRPCTSFLPASLKLSGEGAIEINDFGQTNISSIWAAGDCALTRVYPYQNSFWYSSGSKANRMGRAVGANMAGAHKAVPISPGGQGFVLFGIEFASAGVVGPELYSRENRWGERFAEVLISSGKEKKASEQNGVVTNNKLINTTDKNERLYDFRKLEKSAYIKAIADIFSRKLVRVEFWGKDAIQRSNAAALAIAEGIPLDRLATMDFCYNPYVNSVWEPLNIAASQLLKSVK